MIDFLKGKKEFPLVVVVTLIVVVVVATLIGVRLNGVMMSMVNEPLPGKVIVIDPGHGGVDGGTSSGDILEKNINLEFSLHAADMLRIMGYEVVLTRSGDYSIHNDSAKTIREKKNSDLHNRLVMYNASRLAISFHQDHFSKAKQRGTQIFYGSGNEESNPISYSIKNQIDIMLEPLVDRPIVESKKNVYLFRESISPAILIECGFMSNAEDLKLIQDNTYQQKFTFAIMCGILDYGLF